MKKLYVTATRDNDGKTVVTMGLMEQLRRMFPRVAFIKPLGLKDVRAPGYEVDEDALLMERAFSLHAHIQDMSPVTVDRTSIDEFTRPERQAELMSQVKESFERVSRDADLVMIEGTGHAAVGSVFGMSNARIASELGAKVILVTSGGIGHPLDEVAINMAFFDKHGVEVVGVIFNKARSHEVDKIKTVGKAVLERLGTRLAGVVPYNRVVDAPTMMDVLERLQGRMVLGEKHLGKRIESIQVGAMSAHNALPRLKGRALLITAGDRTDLLLAAAVRSLTAREEAPVAGVVLTGGITPDPKILDILKQLPVAVIAVKDDSYSTAARVKSMTTRVSASDRVKIDLIKDMVGRYVEVEEFVGLL